jgi:hypothetical protein
MIGPWLSLLAAVLTVSIPPMLYTGVLMTENAFYPLFLCGALALVAWLERPDARRTVLLLGLAMLLYLTRAQALAIGAAILTAPPLFVWARRRSGRALGDYRLLYGLVAAGAVFVVVVQAVRGSSPLGILGAYRVAGSSHYTVSAVSKWFLYHVSELDLMLGIVPFAALIVLVGLARRLPAAVQAFLAATVALSFWLVLEVATFASEQAFRIEERNMFYLAPLFLIALLVWIDQGVPRPLLATGIAVAVAAALPGAIPYRDLINVNAVSDTLALLPLWSLEESVVSPGHVVTVVVLVAIAACVLFLAVPRRFALVLPALVLVYFAAAHKPVEGKFRGVSVGSLYAGITLPQRDWIDRAVGRNADVAAVWTGNADAHAIWENEFFNRSVGTIYDTAAPLPGGLPETAVKLDPRTGLLLANGRPVRARYALVDGTMALDGKVIAQDATKGMTLYQPDGPLRQTTRVAGLYPNDTWSGPRVSYTRLGCKGGTVAVLLESDPALYTTPQVVTASVAGHTVGRASVPPRGQVELRVPLRPQGTTCTAVFRVGRTAVPKVVTKGLNQDIRPLGVHFDRFDYAP